MSKNLFENVQKDENLDLSALMTSSSDSTPVKKKLSPLEKMKQEQESETKGLKVSNKELEEGKDKAPRPIQEHSMHTDAMKETLDNLDKSYEKRKAVVVIREPVTAQEYTAMMLEIDAIVFDENGKASYEFYEDILDDSLEEPKYQHVKVDKTPVYTRLRTPEDPEFTEGDDVKFVENHQKFKNLEEKEKSTTDESAIEDEEVIDPVVNEAIQIIIDKTGLGADIHFTDEEKEKITSAREIHLVELENLDISTMTTVRSERSFQDTIRSHQLSETMTSISFPSSGFKVDMTGLSYGEMTDIAMSLSNITFEKYNKRLSVLYNHMTNFSTDEIKSYDDFLKNISVIDINMAMFGSYVSTYPDIQTLNMKCGTKSCPHPTYEWKFSTNSVLNLKKTNGQFIKQMKELIIAGPDKTKELWDNAIVRKSKNIKLPFSGYIVEIGLASAYDYLYNIIPVTDEKTFKETFGDDVNDIYRSVSQLLIAVKSIKIPDKETGNLIEYTNYKDLMDILYSVNPEEMNIISSLVGRIITAYTPVFSINNVVCPTCHTQTDEIETTIEELVFQNHQRLINLNINVESVLGF